MALFNCLYLKNLPKLVLKKSFRIKFIFMQPKYWKYCHMGSKHELDNWYICMYLHASGFRPNHSTTTTLLEVQDYILNNMDKGFATGVIFLDLKKGLWCSKSWNKLASYGIKESELDWFKSYLCNRSQAVHVNSFLSDFKTYNIRIPQGSVLGPLLFIISTNCLPDVVTCKTVMYADDTSLMCKAKNVDDLKVQLESNLKVVANWFKANKLTLNVDKTKFMVFGTNHVLDHCNNINLTFNDKLIERVDVFKYLGIKFDSNMSWSSHIDYLSGNISKRIGVVKHVLTHV